MQVRPVCLSCVSFDVEAVVDGEPADVEFFACFECQDVFYFMADARPRLRRLGAFELYKVLAQTARVPTGLTDGA